jgi:hypothetical protein
MLIFHLIDFIFAAIFADFRAISILPHAAPPCLMPASRQRAVIASAIDCRFLRFSPPLFDADDYFLYCFRLFFAAISFFHAFLYFRRHLIISFSLMPLADTMPPRHAAAAAISIAAIFRLRFRFHFFDTIFIR